MECDGCSLRHLHVIRDYVEYNGASLEVFRRHGGLQRKVKCPARCSKCSYTSDKMRRCYAQVQKNKRRKKTMCSFSISDRKGSFLEGSYLQEWKVLLYYHFFILKDFHVTKVSKRLDMSIRTTVDWHSFCCEVPMKWFENQEPIGGQNIEVKNDETVIARRKYERGRVCKTVWVFGGNGRNNRSKKFIIPLLEFDADTGEERNVQRRSWYLSSRST